MSNPTFEVVTGPIDEPVKMSFTLDPNASPENLTFSFALEYMRFGRKVMRKEWEDIRCALWIDRKMHEILMDWSPEFRLTGQDLLAMDWMVLPRE